MRKIVFFSFFVFPIFVAGQAPLNFNSYAITLCVAQDQSLSLSSRMGEVGLAGSPGGRWRRADISGGILSSPILEQPSFFNKDTGFVSGFINNKDKYNIIYHTTNGGQKWQAVNFGMDGWVDKAVNLDNGEAWMSVGGAGIAYTSDYGFTWKKLSIPTTKQRFTEIFFNTQRQGLIGSLWNMLAYTADNCRNWTLLPTPLDQKKYNKTNRDGRPQFDKVAIYDHYFLVVQENLVFYSNRDSINWTWLPQYSDFYTDEVNSSLFFKTKKNEFVRACNDFSIVQTYNSTHYCFDAQCKNGNLFIVGVDSLIQMNASGVVSVPYSFNKNIETEPYFIGSCSAGGLGIAGNNVFIQSNYAGKWKKLFTLPMPVEKERLSVANEMVVYNRNDDSLFYFNFSGKLQRHVSKSGMFADFGKNGISKIIFSQGTRGCFHFSESHLVYDNIGGEFGGAIEMSDGSGKTNSMPPNEAGISEKVVMEFIKNLPEIFNPDNRVSIQDLSFTQKEYEQCSKDIRAFQASLQEKKPKPTSFVLKENNLDFERLLSLVDSVKTLDKYTVENLCFHLAEFSSTTSYWHKVELVSADNETLTIINRYDDPNAFYLPWTVSLNGYEINTTNFDINRFLKTIYPSFMEEKDRIRVLYSFVKQLY